MPSRAGARSAGTSSHLSTRKNVSKKVATQEMNDDKWHTENSKGSVLERKHRNKRKHSLIAQEEKKNYDKLCYWKYQVQEEQENTPSNHAIVTAVQKITDSLTEEVKTYYDISYISRSCVTKTVQRVPENFLSSKVPIPLPYSVGDEVLTRTLKTCWRNPKNGESSAIKPSYFSNGKARAYNRNALWCCIDGYKDEPPLGWNVNLVPNAESMYYQIPRNRFRKFMVDLTSHVAFESTILILILLNTVALAMIDMNPRYVDPQTYNVYTTEAEGCCPLDLSGNNPPPPNTTCLSCPAVNMVAGHVELFFTIAFTIEMCLKILAMGFVLGPGTYLSNAWNILDFIVVVTGLLDATNLVTTGVGFLRLFRLLRPLRTFSAIPPMKNMISTIINAMGALVYVMTLLIFVILLFGIIMSELFSGALNSRCRLNNLPLQIPRVDLATASLMGWNSTAPYNCMDAQLLPHIYQYSNCSADATELFWHRLWSPNGLVIKFYDNVDAWYYTHQALVANSTSPPSYNDNMLNGYVNYAIQYMDLITTPGAWGNAYNLPNSGLCSDSKNITIPTTFEQCVAVCYDIGLRPEFTCTSPDGTWCQYLVETTNGSIADYSNCDGKCDEFQTRSWDKYNPGDSMCGYCPRAKGTTETDPIDKQFPNNWDSIEHMEQSPWKSPSNTGLGPFSVNPDHSCFWMMDEEDARYCTPQAAGGFHQCYPQQYCGSNYDMQGQPR